MKAKEFLRQKVAFLASGGNCHFRAGADCDFLTGFRVVGNCRAFCRTRTLPVRSILFGSRIQSGHRRGVDQMLSKHTPGSAIEVLLFAIARQMIVEHTTPLENFLTVITIAALFAIRKFFCLSLPSGHIRPTAGGRAPETGNLTQKI